MLRRLCHPCPYDLDIILVLGANNAKTLHIIYEDKMHTLTHIIWCGV